MPSRPDATKGRYRQIKLVVGSPGSGPTGIQEAFVREVSHLKAADPMLPISVLVGSNFLKMHLSRLLAIRLGGHANISFHLLKDLASALGAPSLVDKGRRRLPEIGRELLLREAVSARSHGSYFDSISGAEGFLEALGATLRDLKEAAIDPSALRAAETSGRSKGKLADLADLFEVYDDLLRDRQLYDEEDLMRTAAAGAAARAASRPGHAGPAAEVALVYGFYDLTWTQRLLIQEHLAFRSGAIFFPFESPEAEGAYRYAGPLLDWLAGWITQRVDLPPGDGGGPDTVFLSAPGESREAVEATRWLLGQARGRSLPFGELGLLFRGGDPYRRLLPEVMAQVGGVPHFSAAGSSPSSAPTAKGLLLLLSARSEQLSRRSVIEFLAQTCPGEPIALWDRLSAEAGVTRGIESWRRRLGAPAGPIPPGGQRLELLARVEELHAALETLPSEGTWRGLTDAILDLAGRFIPPEGLSDQILACVTSLGGLDIVASPVRLDLFVSTLQRALERGAVRRPEDGQFQRSGIFVGSVMDARLLSFHAVAVVGLVEKSFPAAARQDPILLDEEREEINRILGAARLSLKARRQDEDRLLFELACRTAVESLLLSYPRVDPATTRVRLPSPFLLRAASEREGKPIDYESLEKLDRTRRVSLSALAPEEMASAIFSREFDLQALRSASSEAADAATRRRLSTFLSSNPILERALKAEQARWGESRFTAHDGVILRPSVLDALRAAQLSAEAPVSASRIEQYASCPLSYFFKEVLRLRPLCDPEDQNRIDPMARGGLMHRILFDLFASLRDRGLLPLHSGREAAALELLDELAAERFREEEASGLVGYPLLWEIDKVLISEDLAEVIRREAAGSDSEKDTQVWEPAHFEIRFGRPRRGEGRQEDPTSDDKPVILDVGSGRTVPVEGRIDRVDLSRDGSSARVTDYKTGRLERYANDALAGGTTVQLPLYMRAAEALLAAAHPGVQTAVARYLSVSRRGEFGQVVFTQEALEARREDLARILTTFSNGVARGVFFAYPEPNTCRNCDYRLACGEGREARFARKRIDDTSADYLRMREGIQ